MRQQINLYQPIFSARRKPLSATAAASILGLAVAGMIGYSLYTGSRIGALSAQVEKQRSEQSQIESQLSDTTIATTARSNPAEIETRVKQLAVSLDERKKALELLQSGAAGQTMGFASRLEALARRHVDGLWIDRLTISGTSGSMSLAGATLNADIVPAYLKSLAQEPVLTGTRFDEFIIERPAAIAVVAEDSTGAKQPARERFIRFRAGNKALDQSKNPGQGET
jgi:hypothetical protein